MITKTYKNLLLLTAIVLMGGFSAKALQIDSHPQNQAVTIDCSYPIAYFDVQASEGVDTYQWQLDGGSGFADLSGETNNSLSVSVTDANMDGNMYRCIVFGSCNNLVDTSNAAGLSVSIDSSVVMGGTGWSIEYPSQGDHIVLDTGGCEAYTSFWFNTSLNEECNFASVINYQWYSSIDSLSWDTMQFETYSYLSIFWSAGSFPSFMSSTNYFMLVAEELGVASDTLIIQCDIIGTDTMKQMVYVSDFDVMGNFNMDILNGCVSAQTFPYNIAVPLNDTIFAGNDTLFPIYDYNWSLDNLDSYSTNVVETNANTLTIHSLDSVSNSDLSSSLWIDCTINISYSDTNICSSTIYPSVLEIDLTLEDYITDQTSDDYVLCQGEPFTNSVYLSGSDSIRWQVDSGSGFTNLQDGGSYIWTTGSQFLASADSLMDGDSYRAVIYLDPACNNPSILYSDSFSVTVSPQDYLPYSTTITESGSHCDGDSVTYTVAASSIFFTPSTYQWQVDSTGSGYVDILDNGIFSGATTTQLNVGPLEQRMDPWMFRCIVDNLTSCSNSEYQPGVILDVYPLTVAQIEPSSIAEVTVQDNITIYPNPNNGTFTITGMSGNYTLSIYSIDGKEIFSSNQYFGEANVNLGKVSKGIYFVKINDVERNIVSTRKVVVR